MHFSTPSTSVPARTPHFSPLSAEAEGAIYAVLAALDFNDAQAVHAAHLRLQRQALALFPGAYFDGVNPDGVARALATLILSPWAGQQNQSTQGIEPGVGDALRSLAERLTPTGQDALLHSLENSHGELALAKYVTHADRHCLAGHLHQRRADAPSFVDAWAAAHAYRQAASAYEQAGAPQLATGAWQLAAAAATQAAAAYLRAYRPLEAADAYELAATAHTQAGQPGQGTDARRRAAAAALTAANGYLLAGAPAQAADAYARVAELCTHTHERLAAAHAWLKAAAAYLRSDRPAQAAHAYLRAAELYTQEARVASAVEAWLKAVDAAWTAADTGPANARYAQTADVCLRVARACDALGQRGAAADAWQRAATAYGRARDFQSAVTAWKQAACACEKTAQPARAGDAYRFQADILAAELGQPLKAAQAYELAATAYRKAATASTAAKDPLAAARHYLMAAQASELAAAAYRAVAPASAGAYSALAGAMHDLMAAHLPMMTGQPMRAPEADPAAPQDEWARHAYTRAGDAFMEAGEFLAAADVYALARRHRRAARAYLKVAQTCHNEANPRQAADAYFRAACHLRLTDQPRDKVAKAFLKAAAIYQREGEDELAADACAKAKQHAQAAALYLKHARACLQTGQPLQAAKAFVRAGFQLRKADRPLNEVAEVFATAAAIYDQQGAQELAARAFMEAGLLPQAVSRFTRLNMPGLVGAAYGRKKMDEKAAGALWQASRRVPIPYGPETEESATARRKFRQQARCLFEQTDKAAAQSRRIDPDL
ncbi:hypothetical protein PSP31121_05416 [Pandoraea sputorum]|uniref:Gamma-soluble NSF attachment protein n=1 Tax=Pandoraea sputorum TaxID=93222 RepID=A0A5E5BJ94_9BURK|nr:hypothetical protein PSP31121_05416 [Pandoraea sputorum]